MNFEELLTADQRKEVLENRILGFSVEAYQVSLNKKVAEAVNDVDGIQQSQNSLAMLEIAIGIYKDELATIA